jgi:hypothetical protein
MSMAPRRRASALLEMEQVPNLAFREFLCRRRRTAADAFCSGGIFRAIVPPSESRAWRSQLRDVRF